MIDRRTDSLRERLNKSAKTSIGPVEFMEIVFALASREVLWNEFQEVVMDWIESYEQMRHQEMMQAIESE